MSLYANSGFYAWYSSVVMKVALGFASVRGSERFSEYGRKAVR